MYYVGIDISKYKHNCFILDSSGNVVVRDFNFNNDLDGFNSFFSLPESFGFPENIKIVFEANGHYTSSLMRFLENTHYSFMESNPTPSKIMRTPDSSYYELRCFSRGKFFFPNLLY